MKTAIHFFLLIFIILYSCQRQPNKELQNRTYHKLEKIIRVKGRQGIAADENYYYNTGSTALYKYDKTGKLIAENTDPFKDLKLEANHFGDIDVWKGEIYCGIEFFKDGIGKNIQIAVYDTETLNFKYSIPFDPASGQNEVCGLTIDKTNGKIWMADWVNGKYLYRYDLKRHKYEGKVRLLPAPGLQQGIFYKDGKIFISADDGDADILENDNIYVTNIERQSDNVAAVSLFKTCDDFRRTGEIEGLCIDPVTKEMLILNNRGSHIVLGMVKGLYEGYSEEIHEVYIYK